VAVGMKVGIIGFARGVFVTNDANVVAMASSIGTFGVDTVRLGREHELTINNENISMRYFMRRLYKFSEQFNIHDVLRVKE
jgi:hypothetical protein